MSTTNNGINEHTIVNNANAENNKNYIMTLDTFPKKSEIIAIREKMQISSFLQLIRNRMYNSFNPSITLTMEDIRPYTGVMDKVFRSLMTDKEFTVMRTETPQNNGDVVFSYTISW